jgi:hypothetical protein
MSDGPYPLTDLIGDYREVWPWLPERGPTLGKRVYRIVVRHSLRQMEGQVIDNT